MWTDAQPGVAPSLNVEGRATRVATEHIAKLQDEYMRILRHSPGVFKSFNRVVSVFNLSHSNPGVVSQFGPF